MIENLSSEHAVDRVCFYGNRFQILHMIECRKEKLLAEKILFALITILKEDYF